MSTEKRDFLTVCSCGSPAYPATGLCDPCAQGEVLRLRGVVEMHYKLGRSSVGPPFNGVTAGGALPTCAVCGALLIGGDIHTCPPWKRAR